jgi:hypothetical protein
VSGPLGGSGAHTGKKKKERERMNAVRSERKMKKREEERI